MNKTEIKPSKYHPNRSSKNWLVYNTVDSFLIKNKLLYKGTLYDLGCGTMPYKHFFLQYVTQYIGVDWKDNHQQSNEDIIADLNKLLPIDAEVADCIISLSVMEHLKHPQQFLDEAFRLLKPNGYIVIQVPWQWSIHEAPHDFFRYTSYCLKYMFENAGFKKISIEPQSGFFTMWVLKFNYFSARFIRGPKYLRLLIKVCLSPFWFIGQISAPFLDRIDKNWEAETIGFFVTAKKCN